MVSLYNQCFPEISVVNANSVDPDQMTYSVASALGLHRLPIILMEVSRLEWVKHIIRQSTGLIQFICFFFI